MSTLKVTLLDQTLDVPKGISLLELSRQVEEQYESAIVAAKVNNVLKDLSFRIEEDSHIDFIDLTTDDGFRIYQRSVSFLLIKAVGEVFPQATITIEHSISKGLYCELHGIDPLTEKDVQAIERR